MKKLILFDLDNTLLDSASFRKSIYPRIVEILRKNNNKHTEEDIEKLIKEYIDRIGLFDPDQIVDHIASDLQDTDKQTMKDLFYNTDIIKKFFYQEVVEEIGKFAHLGEVGALTQGFVKFQSAKLKGILEHFHPERIHIAKDKRKEMFSIFNSYKDYKIYYIDDLLMMLQKAKEVRNDVITVLMKRPNVKKQDELFTPDKEVINLTELYSFIENT